jgi:hypothetical protein
MRFDDVAMTDYDWVYAGIPCKLMLALSGGVLESIDMVGAR